MVEDPRVHEGTDGDHAEERGDSQQGDRPAADRTAARKPEQRRVPEGVQDPQEDAAPECPILVLQSGQRKATPTGFLSQRQKAPETVYRLACWLPMVCGHVLHHARIAGGSHGNLRISR